ncbi:MAG TPA: osmotically inducible protein C [Firmicutes bacterium]|nr:osmotically inducible protein C [Bacillota bacterium]
MLTCKVKAKGVSGTKTLVQAGGFKITIDEPETSGGTNEGASPIEYLLAALSGCLNVVSHKVAAEMGFELRDVDIELEGVLDPRGFAGKSPETRAGFQEIKVILKPDADSDETTLQRWLQAVEQRCPVSDTIANPTSLSIFLG